MYTYNIHDVQEIVSLKMDLNYIWGPLVEYVFERNILGWTDD